MNIKNDLIGFRVIRSCQFKIFEVHRFDSIVTFASNFYLGFLMTTVFV